MAYIDPKMVLSPKGRVEDLVVLYDGGEHSYAVARMTWDKSPGAIGVRWNGGEGEGVGNPQSRGVATWFILPEPIAKIVEADPAHSLRTAQSLKPPH